jgi:MerR family transcriptional regulator/heat shock protein HspR
MTTSSVPRDHGAELPEATVPVYVISVAAQLSGLHPQTLRQYDRLGLVSPSRTTGGRLYSWLDVERLREVQRLAASGLNLEGIKQVLALEAEVVHLRARVEALEAELDGRMARRRELVPLPSGGGALVIYRSAPRP